MGAILSTFMSQNRNKIPNLLKLGIPGEYAREGIVFETIAL